MIEDTDDLIVDDLPEAPALDEIAHAAGGFMQDGRYVHPDAARSFFIHREARVAPTAVIFPGAFIGPHVEIGEHCVVGPNAAIGQPGFGYTELDDGSWAYRQHIGGVVIEDDVHIGACACIDQGRHRETRVGRGTRIDDHVFIAHNVHVGEHCLLIAHAMVAGSCDIGDRAIISPGAQVLDHIRIGPGALVGLGAVVVKDVPGWEVWVGNPAKYLRARGEELR